MKRPNGRLIPVEEVPRLDASELAWSGILERGADGEMWPFDNLTEATEDLSYSDPHLDKLELVSLQHKRVSESQVNLLATFDATRPTLSDDRPIEDRRYFTLVSTTPHFGGKRWWFECPGCACQRTALYLVPCLYSLCRVCLNLTYETRQRDNRASRHGNGQQRFGHLLRQEARALLAAERRALRRRVQRAR
ncbi:MAG: hypothetical protein P8R48_04180 [Planctomycetota bacterium]|nr:hypothetical protein [Planctomycetota bacterium]